MASTQPFKVADLFKLTGKTVIATGATGGIGLVVVLALAESGADIVSIQVPNDPQSEVLANGIREKGRKLNVFECDLRDSRSIADTFQRIWDAGIVPDILFHCAGITHNSSIENTSVAILDNVINLNARAAYLVSQEFGKKMISLNRPGKIIHIASMATEVVQENISVYTSTKSFVRTMTKALSNEWARKGIQCNCISPGFIKTPMTQALHSDPKFSQNVVERTSSGRWGVPEDLIGAVVFLASRASNFVTGENIVIDGGVIGR